MAAKTIPGYYGKLVRVLETTDRILPVGNVVDLINRLNNDGDFTTVLVQDTVGYEVIKVINFRGDIAIERGLSGTQVKRFPMGSCVTFTPSDELLKSLSCEAECCKDGADLDYGKATPAPNTTPVERLPNAVVGSINAVLGEPTGFMLVNGKKVPYYE